MEKAISFFCTSKFLRYILTGGVSYLSELCILIFLANILLLTPALAVACSFWVGLIVSFVLQKYVVFQNKKKDKRSMGKQVTLYGIVVGFNYLFTIVFVGLFAGKIGLINARTCALALTVLWNFLLYSKVIFKYRA